MLENDSPKLKVLTWEKDDHGSLDLVVKGEGEILDVRNSILAAQEYCFSLAENKDLLAMDPYKETRQKILDFLANHVNKDIERINDRGEDINELGYDVKERINLIIESINYKQNALKDGLTDLYNRKFLNGFVRDKFKENTHRDNFPVSIIMFDTDHFKDVNDTYGHPAGDQVLKAMARIMKNFVREGDFCIRYGGEEFTFILFNCTKENAIKRGEQFRKMIESFKTEINQNGMKVTIPITVSIGVSTYTHLSDNQNSEETFNSLITEADGCMYDSKNNGRNNLAYKKDGELAFTKNNIPVQQDRKKAVAV